MKLKDVETLALGRYVLETFPEERIEEMLTEMEEQRIISWRYKPSYHFILETICRIMDVDLDDVRSESRKEPLPLARQLYVYLTLKIHFPEYVEAIDKPPVYRSYLPHGSRALIIEKINRSVSLVNNYLTSVTNYTQVDRKFSEDIKYLERVIFREFQAQRNGT